MSRIDEALKKSSPPHGIADHRAASAALADESTLDNYPREHRRPASERPAREVTYAREVPQPREIHQARELSQRVVVAPRTGERGQLGLLSPELDARLIVGRGAATVAVEQYRRVAATMHDLQMERGLKALLVTSALPGEGKSLTVTNLALTLSESYKRRVLLIDADLRRPSVHEIFKLPNKSGLSEGLRADRSELSVLNVSSFLSVLPAGQPDANPMAALTSDRMRALLEQSTASYDWVLLDAPPVGLMPDANLLARLTRAVLFVIGAGSTPFSLVQRAIDEVGRECVVGTVLNRIEERLLPSSDYYRDYYSAPELPD